MKVAVIGAAGYVGGELLRLVLQHPDVTSVTATSRSHAGEPIAERYPAMALLTDARFSGEQPLDGARGHDVVFLALAHGESSRVMGDLIDSGVPLIVDLAADFRIHDGALHRRFYGEHPVPELVHYFTYGLADIAGVSLRGHRAVAAPGCFATAAQIALRGLAELPLDGPPVIFAVTGSSGAGQSPGPNTHHPARAHNMFAYSGMQHRHDGEILEQWRRWRGNDQADARLICHSGPFVRGIHVTLHARCSESLAPGAGRAAVSRAFKGRPFVQIRDTPPQLTQVIGSNLALLHVRQSDDGREVEVICVLDNLIKGAGGQAMQAMNLVLGLDERAGLMAPGVFPC